MVVPEILNTNMTFVRPKRQKTPIPARIITRPEMITQIIRKQFFCVTDVCVIGKFIPRQLTCVIETCA